MYADMEYSDRPMYMIKFAGEALEEFRALIRISICICRKYWSAAAGVLTLTQCSRTCHYCLSATRDVILKNLSMPLLREEV